MGSVAVLELGDDPDRLHVVVEAAKGRHFLVQDAFTGMAERRVTEIVREGDGLGQILVETHGASDGAGHLADFERMRQPGAEMLALVVEEDLGLVLQAAEGGRMDDPVAVTLEFGARRALGR